MLRGPRITLSVILIHKSSVHGIAMRRLARYSTSHILGSINDEALTETYYVRNLRTLLEAAVSPRAAYGHPGERWAGPLYGVRLFVVRDYGESGFTPRQGENSVESQNSPFPQRFVSVSLWDSWIKLGFCWVQDGKPIRGKIDLSTMWQL